MLREAISESIDRGALSNVIFQKQGEVTASLLPQSLTGYAFLFPADRDLNKANELRGGLTPPPLVMSADGDGTMQLAAQRIALNLHEAGFSVQVANARNAPHADMVLRKLPLEGADPAAALETLLRGAGENVAVAGRNPNALFRAVHDVLDLKTLIPLLDLPAPGRSAAACAMCACAPKARRTSPERRWRAHSESSPKAVAPVFAYGGRGRSGGDVDRAGAHSPRVSNP